MFSFELSNFGLRLIQFGLQFRIPLDRVGMPAFPVTHVTTQSIHLLTQLGMFTPLQESRQADYNASLFSHNSSHR